MKPLYFLLVLIPLFGHSQNQEKRIYLDSGRVLNADAVYFYSSYKNSYIRINNKVGEIIPIDQVNYIEGKGRYFNPINVDNGNTWGERTFSSDRIKIYSTYNLSFNHHGKSGNYYFKDDQRAKMIKYKYLKSDLYDNDLSVNYLKKANRIRHVQGGLLATSIVMFTIGAIQESNNEQNAKQTHKIPIIPLVGGINLFLYLLEYPKKKYYRKALKGYK